MRAYILIYMRASIYMHAHQYARLHKYTLTYMRARLYIYIFIYTHVDTILIYCAHTGNTSNTHTHAI